MFALVTQELNKALRRTGDPHLGVLFTHQFPYTPIIHRNAEVSRTNYGFVLTLWAESAIFWRAGPGLNISQLNILILS